MKSIFDLNDSDDLKERIKLLQHDSKAEWGRMNIAQMCAHCSRVLDINAGLIEESKPPFFMKLLRPLIYKTVFGPKPYPKNGATSPQFKIVEECDFEVERQKLIRSIDYWIKHKHAVVANPSKVFGKLSETEKGWSQYKHLDHHLRQFGV